MPGGRWAFSIALGRMVPYTGSISPRVADLQAGRAVVVMRDRAKVRNHLNCIHAIALINLGEIASGLAMLSGLPDEARGIVTRLSIEYLKKARGTTTAECTVVPPDWRVSGEHDAVATLKDLEGDVVARVCARWKIGPTA
jgi:acyl-coenzyme A thioesterase PaaI-like protein